jgi:hypothetical protein
MRSSAGHPADNRIAVSERLPPHLREGWRGGEQRENIVIPHRPGTGQQRIRSGTRQSSDKRIQRPEFWQIQLRAARIAS